MFSDRVNKWKEKSPLDFSMFNQNACCISIMKKFYSLLLLLSFTSFAYAQSSVKGVVKNLSGELLPGANVVLTGTGRGSTTNLQGQFDIRNIPAGNYSLRVSFMGYEPVTQ